MIFFPRQILCTQLSQPLQLKLSVSILCDSVFYTYNSLVTLPPPHKNIHDGIVFKCQSSYRTVLISVGKYTTVNVNIYKTLGKFYSSVVIEREKSCIFTHSRSHVRQRCVEIAEKDLRIMRIL